MPIANGMPSLLTLPSDLATNSRVPRFQFWWLPRATRRTQENATLATTVTMKSANEEPDEEVQRARSREVLSTGAFVPLGLGCTIPLARGGVHWRGRFPRLPHLGVCMEVSSCRHDWGNPWPLVTEFKLQPLFPPQSQGVGLKVPTFWSWLGLSRHQPPS